VVRGDENQVICIQKRGVLFFEQTCFPLYGNEEDETFEKLEYYLNQVMWWRLGIPPSPAGLDEPGQKIREESARALRESTDRAIYGTFGGNLIEIGEVAAIHSGYYQMRHRHRLLIMSGNKLMYLPRAEALFFSRYTT